MPQNDTLLKQLISEEIASGRNFTTLYKSSGAERANEKAVEARDKADRALSVTEPEMPPSAPSAPTGVVVEPWGRALSIKWDRPPATEHVVQSEVRLYENPPPAPGEVAERHITRDYSHISTDLLLKEYEVWVRHIDRWDREGAWATTLSTPLPNAADRVSAGTEAMGSRFADLLNNPNLNGFTSPAKLADATVMALQDKSGIPRTSSDVIGADLLATWDLAAARAVIGTAVIEQGMIRSAAIGDAQIDRASVNRLRVLSADIVSLTADKIRTGSLDVGVEVRAGQVRLDSTGLAIPKVTAYGLSGTSKAYKITSTDDQASIYFTNAPQGRGVVVQGDSSTNTGGYATLAGVNNTDDWEAWGNATVRALGFFEGVSQVNLRAIQVVSNARDLIQFDAPLTNATGVIGPLYASGRYATQVYVNSTTLANNTQIEQPHRFGEIPAHIDVLYDTSGGWRTAVNGTNGLQIVAGTGSVVIANASGASRTVRAHINGGTFT